MAGEATVTLLETPDLDQPKEKRAWVRYACLLQGQCRPIAAMDVGSTWPAQTLDLSIGGVALRVCRRFEPGTLLALDLIDDADEPMSMPLARVRYAISVGPYWMLGCSWAEELEPSEMRMLLGATHEWDQLPGLTPSAEVA